MTSSTFIQDAAIGEVSFQQHDTEAFGFSTDEWIARSRELYHNDPRTLNTTWMPWTSEIIIDDIDKPLRREDGVDDVRGGIDHRGIARECMFEAFEQLSEEGEATQ